MQSHDHKRLRQRLRQRILFKNEQVHIKPTNDKSPISIISSHPPIHRPTLAQPLRSFLIAVATTSVFILFTSTNRSAFALSTSSMVVTGSSMVVTGSARKRSFSANAFTNASTSGVQHCVGSKMGVGFLSSLHSTANDNNQNHNNNNNNKNNNNDNYPKSSASSSPVRFKALERNDGQPFSAHGFASTKCWGNRPLLWRKAFVPPEPSNEPHSNNENVPPWPSWDEVLSYATDDDAEARIISHVPHDIHSWELDVGSFATNDLDTVLEPSPPTTTVSKERKHTLILNDVDRYHPLLSDWIFDTFSFLPQWRRDDGQISLSHRGGGIGPHVDNYDVFLIQTTGSRLWEVGTRLVSVAEEMEDLVDGLDVRVLASFGIPMDGGDDGHSDGNDSTTIVPPVESFVLEPGDVLYLPPRVPHCGTALENYSSTLSVGLRAPSTKDLLAKLVDEVGDRHGGSIIQRYSDPHLLENLRTDQSDGVTVTDGAVVDNGTVERTNGKPPIKVRNDDDRTSRNEITPDVTKQAKTMLRDAIHDLIEDDSFFDSFIGRLVTGSNRFRIDYPPPLMVDNEDDCNGDVTFVSAAQSMVESMIEGEETLYSAEGIAWAYSRVINDRGDNCGETRYVNRLFVDGNVWELPDDDECVGTGSTVTYEMVRTIVDHRMLNRKILMDGSGDIGTNTVSRMDLPKGIVRLLEDLVRRGFLYQ